MATWSVPINNRLLESGDSGKCEARHPASKQQSIVCVCVHWTSRWIFQTGTIGEVNVCTVVLWHLLVSMRSLNTTRVERIIISASISNFTKVCYKTFFKHPNNQSSKYILKIYYQTECTGLLTKLTFILSIFKSNRGNLKVANISRPLSIPHRIGLLATFLNKSDASFDGLNNVFKQRQNPSLDKLSRQHLVYERFITLTTAVK